MATRKLRAVWDYFGSRLGVTGHSPFRHPLNSFDAAASLSGRWGCPRFCPYDCRTRHRHQKKSSSPAGKAMATESDETP